MKKNEAKFPLLRLKLTENEGALDDLETKLKNRWYSFYSKAEVYLFTTEKRSQKRSKVSILFVIPM